MKILVTGTAGFIGYHLVKKLSEKNIEIIGIDSLNEYYDINLKYSRLLSCGIDIPQDKNRIHSTIFPNYSFYHLNICDKLSLERLFEEHKFDYIVNLAAQAGVRYSITHPESYIENNISGFLNILECCKKFECKKLIYASSSSVYGNNESVPFKESDKVDNPVSIYAASKKSNELMASTYSNLYSIETIGLRFFTVYGPFGRPDMAPMLFADAIQNNKEIKIFNNGVLFRDFTYIDDIIDGIEKIIFSENQFETLSRIYNIGRGEPVNLFDFILTLENNFNKEVKKKYVGMQPGDVYKTWADTSLLQNDYGYSPKIIFNDGIARFVKWYKEYYK